jgi:hypothetical protein
VGDLVSELKHLENTDEILGKHIVDVVKEIRQFQEETDTRVC